MWRDRVILESPPSRDGAMTRRTDYTVRIAPSRKGGDSAYRIM